MDIVVMNSKRRIIRHNNELRMSHIWRSKDVKEEQVTSFLKPLKRNNFCDVALSLNSNVYQNVSVSSDKFLN